MLPHLVAIRIVQVIPNLDQVLIRQTVDHVHSHNNNRLHNNHNNNNNNPQLRVMFLLRDKPRVPLMRHKRIRDLLLVLIRQDHLHKIIIDRQNR